MFIQPVQIMYITKNLLPVTIVLTSSTIITSLVIGLLISPSDLIQQDIFKIIYIHVPSAWLSLVLYLFVTLLSIFYFIFKNRIYMFVCISLVRVDFVFTTITLVTGSLWGASTWGTYWIWDARLTSVFILFILLICYLIVYHYTIRLSNAYTILSAFSMFSFIIIPIIKYSVNWWNTLHQVETLSISNNHLHPVVFISLLLWTLSLLLYSIYIALLDIRQQILKSK